MRPVVFTIYKGRRNTIRPVVTLLDVNGDEQSLPWTNVTRMELSILADPVVDVNTDTNPGCIDYSVAGELTLTIGELTDVAALDEGEYYARLCAYDSTGRRTEIWNEDHPRTPVILRVMDA